MRLGIQVLNEHGVAYGGVCDTSDVKDPYPVQIRGLVAHGLLALYAQVMAGKADHLWSEITEEELEA